MLFKGKTMEEAVNAGLETLKISEDEAEVTLVDTEVKRGLFGKEKKTFTVSVEKKAEGAIKKEKKVEVKEEVKPEKKEVKKVEKKEKPIKKEENTEKKVIPYVDNGGADKAKDFVIKIYQKLGVEVKAEIVKADSDGIIIKVESENGADVIGHRGETLDSVQNIAGAIANIGRKDHIRLVVDCEGYREKREETLISLAKRTADKAVERQRKTALEPMSAYERRVIHSALVDDERVTTESDGKEPNRYIVIIPKELKDNKIEFGGRRNNDKNHNRNNKRHGHGGKRFDRPKNEVKSIEKKQITFGTFLGNSLDDKND